jgi:protein TonB
MPRMTPETYPPEALRDGIEGTVVVELTVDVRGRVADVRLVASSGWSVLDLDALVRAREFAFAPIPAAQRVRVPVRYRLT